MSNQVQQNNVDADNLQNTETNPKENSQDQTKNIDNINESTEKQDIQQQLNDENTQNDIKDTENNQNIENTENTYENQTNEQMQQAQSAKSNIGRNRHITTNEEKEILSKALPEYLKLPNRTTDRQNKERNVAKKLKALSPECNQYWTYKKVRDWFNNNNPDKRNKNQDTENQHPQKKAVMVPGSAPIRFFTTDASSNSSFIPENQRIPELSNRLFAPYLSNQNRSQFVKCYNPNPDTPTSSAILSLNSNTKFFSAAQNYQPTSLSETYVPCYTNSESSVQQSTKNINDGENIQNPNKSAGNITRDHIVSIVPYDIATKDEHNESSISTNTQIQPKLQILPQPQTQPQNQQTQQLQTQQQQIQTQQQQIQLQPQLHQHTQIIQPQINQIQNKPSQIQQIQPPQINQPQIQPQIQPPQISQSQIQQQIQPPPPQPLPIQPQIQQSQPPPMQPPSINQQQIQQQQISPIQQSSKMPPQPLINQPQIHQQPMHPPQIQQIQPPSIQQIHPPQIQQIQPPPIQQINPSPIRQIQPPQIHQPPPIQSQQINQSPLIQISQNQPPKLNQSQLYQPSQIQPQQLHPNQPPQLRNHQLPQIQVPNNQSQPVFSQIQQSQYPKNPQMIPQQIIRSQQPPIPPPPSLLPQMNQISYQQISETNTIQSQNNNNQDENIPKSPNGERIAAELPKNMISNKNSPKKKSLLKKAFEKDMERYESIKKRLDENQSPPSAQIYDFHPTPYEKYQLQHSEQIQQQQQQQNQQNQQESYSVPNSFIEFKKNPESTLVLSSSYKARPKPNLLKADDESNEFDPLPKVPEEELRSYIKKLKSITLKRISELLNIIEERKILIHKHILNINYENKRKSRKKNKEDENIDYSSSSETESNNKDDETESVEKEKENDSLEKSFVFNHDAQLDFELKTENRMNELINFYHSNFDNQSIKLTFLIGSTKKPISIPRLLTKRSLIESGEFSPGNKSKSGENIEEILNERKCIVNFDRNTNFQTKIHVPKDIQRDNERIAKFYRGEFEKKESIPLAMFEDIMEIENSLFFDNSEEIFLISSDIQEGTSLFVFNDSFIQTPFKKSNKNKALCQFPSLLGLNNLVLATDGEQLVYFNVESMNADFIYRISNENEKRIFLNKFSKSESCKALGKSSINTSYFFQSSANPSIGSNINTAEKDERVAICATSYRDVVVGKGNHIYFFNREKNESTFYDSIKLPNMKNISSICAFQINSISQENEKPFSVPLICVGSADYSTIYAYNGIDHSLVARLVGHTSGISCLYSKGTVLFSGSIDGSIIMWEFKLIPDDQNQEQKENKETETENKNYTVFAYCSLTLLIHSAPIVAMRQETFGNIQFLISCDKNLIWSTDIGRNNYSFSISVPEEFSINSLNFNGSSGEVDFILSSREITNRMEIFGIDK